MEYYQHEKLSARITRIIDFTGVCCYLVTGEKKACLLDTCNGYGNIRKYAETLTDKPLFVVLTHGHHDHTGGAAWFDEVYMTPVEKPMYEEFNDLQARIARGKQNPMTKDIPDQDYTPLITEEMLPLSDHQRFDLGQVTIEMILVPGHCRGMMVPFIKEERTMIFGDACGVGVLLGGVYSCSASEYRNALQMLKSYESDFDTILRNHGTFCSPKELLDNVIECCDEIISHTDAHQPVVQHGRAMFSCKAVDDKGNRLDGKQGNINYTEDKAC